MPLTIKNEEVERLVRELSSGRKLTKTELVRRALLLYRQREGQPTRPRSERVRTFLEEAAPLLEEARMPDKAEREAILGYGAEGV
ncbi:MAG TPA: protein transcription factor [Oceanithermus profundus]|uniref:Protein transcription factor n=1 Tax=Oceanithermus profundus TaxID=187137 RepID=A0A7C4VBX4_9DEIN|nr:protein transcription factor [Oceanithermus profundus]